MDGEVGEVGVAELAPSFSPISKGGRAEWLRWGRL
jgi:hypothetical protein